jgi:hypothetical protein
MANIATVAVAAVVRPGRPDRPVTARGLLRAMTRYFGRSYCVPTWAYDDYPRGRIYVQHGEKGSPTGVVRAWERFGRFLDAIWVRWYDSGADHDAIFRYAGDGYGPSVRCRYAFDAVRLRPAAGFEPPVLGRAWRPAEGGAWLTDSSGSYFAGNDRSVFSTERGMPLPSRTTPVGARLLIPALGWAADDMPDEWTRIEAVVSAQAAEVEFLHRRRPTRVYRRHDGRWWQWPLDDWDNCADPGWEADRRSDEGGGGG